MSKAGSFRALFILITGTAAACASSPDATLCTGSSACGSDDDNPKLEPAAGCKATPGPDLPDDDFADTNCDGVDGDKALSIFVAPGPKDAGNGSPEQPFSSLSAAIAAAEKSGKSQILVCNGTYDEAVLLKGKALSIFGGYDCKGGWKRNTQRATIAPAAGVPLTIRDVTDELTVSRLALKAADATQPSGSSIALFVSSSKRVSIDHADIVAGRGVDGVTPPAPAAATSPATRGADGQSLQPASCNTILPFNNRPFACKFPGVHQTATPASPCESAGGDGGDGGNVVLTMPHRTGGNGEPAGVGGQGAYSTGQSGSRGADGLDGEHARRGVGTLSADGYLPTNRGTDGTDGSPGGGGAGGGGGGSRYIGDTTRDYYVGGGGGQGGFGGCGGASAKGAAAGGASIGIALFQSTIKISRSHITTSQGGRGGRSVEGAPGQAGGEGGLGGTGTVAAANAYPGGKGGDGGRGGNGGGGGGGPSVGVLSFDSDEPSLTAVAFNVGTPGKGGSPHAADGIVGETGKAPTR